MRLKKAIFTAILLAISAASQATAQEKNCKFYPEGGLLKRSYELIGPEACKDACTQTDGCKAWSYTPHTFNPTSAPGDCRMMEAVSEEAENDEDFCGRL